MPNKKISQFTEVFSASTESYLNLVENGQNVKITKANFIDDALTIKESLSTGFITGLELSINLSDNTKVDIAPGAYVITDYTDPLNPKVKIIQLPEGIVGITPQYLTTSNASYIALDADMNVVQSASPFENEDRRSLAIIGAAIHSNLTFVNVTNEIKAPLIASTNQLHDFIKAVGALNLTGNVYGPNGSDLTIDKTAGQIWALGIDGGNFLDPHRLTISGQTQLSFRYRLKDSTEFADTQFIDPNNYDSSSGFTVTPTGKFTIQHINLFQSGLTRIQYGQNLYDTMDEARALVQLESFEAETNIAENSIFRAFLIIKEGVLDLSQGVIDDEVDFIPVDKFGNVIGGAGFAITFNDIVTALGYVPENVANKIDIITSNSSVNYTTENAVVNYVSGQTANIENHYKFVNLGVITVTGDTISAESTQVNVMINDLLDNTNLIVDRSDVTILKVVINLFGSVKHEVRKYYLPDMVGKGTYSPVSAHFTIEECELAYKELISNTIDTIDSYPNVTIFDLGTTPTADFVNYINTNGATYNLTDMSMIYYFRYDFNGVDYIYVFNPIGSVFGYDIYGLGEAQFSASELQLFFNSSLPEDNSEEVIVRGTYNELATIANNNQLVIGAKYILTDYQTKYVINGSDSSTRQQVHTMIGSSGAYTQFANVPSTIVANGDTVTCVFAPIGASIVTGQTFFVVDYFNTAFIRFSPSVTGGNNFGAQFRFEKQRYANIPNNIVINDINGKPVIKPSGVLNTEVHDGLPYMSMTGVENPTPITEEIVLTAIDVNKFSPNAESLTFVGDSLTYDFNNNIINDDNGFFKDNKNGTILKRTNIDNTISVNKDWRVQRYRRYRMDDFNWGQYLLRKELSQNGATSGSTIYKFGATNFCTNTNPTLSLEHRYIVPEPFIANFYLDFAKNSNNIFLSGVTSAPSVTIGDRLPVAEHTTEFSVDMSLPLGSFSGTTAGRDLHIIPLNNNIPNSQVQLFKVRSLSNTVFTMNSQRYGNSQPIYVDSEFGMILNSSFMTGNNIENLGLINRLNSTDNLSLKNTSDLVNVNSLGYYNLTNYGILYNVTFGIAFTGSGTNEFMNIVISDNTIMTDVIMGGNRQDIFMYDSFLANRTLLINAAGSSSKIGGHTYLTMYKNAAGTYGSSIDLRTYLTQKPGKGYFGHIYDFNTQLSDRIVNNFTVEHNLIYQNISGGTVNIVTVAPSV